MSPVLTSGSYFADAVKTLRFGFSLKAAVDIIVVTMVDMSAQGWQPSVLEHSCNIVLTVQCNQRFQCSFDRLQYYSELAQSAPVFLEGL